ncbi:MAG: tetratricopeptide repeat protein [Bacteroidia bacterium]
MKTNWKLPLQFLLLFLGVFLTYSNHFHNSFHFDDSHTIVNNGYIRDIHNIPTFFKDGNTFSSLPSNRSYRPLVSTTLAMDYALGGDKDTFWFHLSTFILFLAQGFCMFYFVRAIYRFVLPGQDLSAPALFTCAWYMLHPVNAETINYIISRSDTLSTLFVVLAFLLYSCSARSRKYFLYLIPVALGALAKPTAVMFAPILFVFVFLFERKEDSATAYSHVKMAFLKTWPVFLVCALVYLFIHRMEPSTWVAGGEGNTWNYILTQPFVIFRYFCTFFLPVDLSADTDWKTVESILDIRCLTGFLFLGMLIGAIYMLSRKKTYTPIAFGLSWFLLALLPTSITPLAEVMNDHRMFFPYVGLVVSVTWALYLLIEKLSGKIALLENKDILKTGAGILLLCYAFGTHERNRVWHTEESLWKDVTEKSPRNGRAQMNFGLSLMQKGDYTGAEKYFTQGLSLWPAYPYLYINMGVLKEATGRSMEAETNFRKALQFDQAMAGTTGSRNPECYFFYARFLKNQHRYSEATDYLIQLFQLAPGHLNGHYLLMEIYQQQGFNDKLKQEALNTLQLSPGDATANAFLQNPGGGNSSLKAMDELIIKANNFPTPENYLELSLAFYNNKDYKLCINAAKEAIKLKKDFAQAWNNIGAANGQLQNWDEEIIACREALRINPSFELAKNNLAWALQHKK